MQPTTFPQSREVTVRVLTSDPDTRARMEAAVDGATIAVSGARSDELPELGELLVVDRLTAERTGLLPGAPATDDDPAVQAVKAQVRKSRHTLNNRLTAALAEVQLVLLDPPEGELLESFEIIRDQLYSIKHEIANSLTFAGPSVDWEDLDG